MQNLGERLLAARKAKKMTQQQLATKAGLTQATISDIERGRNQTTIEAPALARALGVSLDYLLMGSEPLQPVETFPRPASSEDFAFIPLYSAMGSCGDGYENSEHVEIKKTLAFNREWLRMEGLAEKNLSIITAAGDSMSPTITDGSILLINSQYGRLESGRVYALLHSGEVRVKRLFAEFTGAWRIASDNSNKTLYPDSLVAADAMDSLQIIGRVVWTGGKL